MPSYLNQKHKFDTDPMSGKFRQGSTRSYLTTFALNLQPGKARAESKTELP